MAIIALVVIVGAWFLVNATMPRRLDTLNLPRVTWDGGPGYYERFPVAAAAGWTDPSFFPIGVWFESAVQDKDVAMDKAAGINTYVELTQDSDMNLVRSHGMSAITSKPLKGAGAETVGWLITDEADMFGGPGDGTWSGAFGGEGPVCVPEKPPCGYTMMRTLKDRLPKGDGRMFYANYGKGVLFWGTPAEAGRFVNGYTDVTSADAYWYTDVNICGEAREFLQWPAADCPLAADYGAVLDKERLLDAADGRLQPIYAFVELGWPMTSGTRAIKPEEMAGAVMSSLVHEARGVIYFNHNFGGPCPSQHILREECGAPIRSAVTEMNRRIRELAPVLNTQSYVYQVAPGLDTMLKCLEGSCYVFAVVKRAAPTGSHTLTLPPELAGASRVEVLYENRTIPVGSGRTFTDSFDAEYSYHIYKITP
jgi:hypothetical protein